MSFKPNWFTLLALEEELKSHTSAGGGVGPMGGANEKLRQEVSSVKSSEGKLLSWLRSVSPQVFEKAISRSQQASFLSGGLGLLMGILMGSGVLVYSGDKPINIFVCLTFFFLLPCLGALISIFGFFPSSAPFSSFFAQLNPLPFILSKIGLRESSASAFSRGALRRTLLVYVNQFGAMFFLGALVSFFALLTFSDLAFGWSSTLVNSSSEVAAGLQAISWPWSQLVPSAVPSETLVEATRFFRLDDSVIQRGEAQAYGSWWPFLMMCLLCYGFLPRVLMYCLAGVLSRREMARLHLSIPESKTLLWSLNEASPDFVFTAGDPLDDSPESEDKESAESDSRIPADFPDQTVVISWGFSCEPNQLQSLPGYSDDWRTFSLATREGLEEDEIEAKLLGQKPETICILVKAWSTPTNEIFDLAKRFLDIAPVTFLPVALEEKNLSTASSKNYGIWYRRVAKEAEEGIRLRSI